MRRIHAPCLSFLDIPKALGDGRRPLKDTEDDSWLITMLEVAGIRWLDRWQLQCPIFKWCLVGVKEQNVYQENIPRTITPPAWTVDVMLLMPDAKIDQTRWHQLLFPYLSSLYYTSG